MEDLEEYLIHGRYKEGLKKCEKASKKSKVLTSTLVFKARFLQRLGQRNEALAIIKSLSEKTPSITEPGTLFTIEDFLWEDSRDEHYPVTLSNGDIANKLWTNCWAATPKAQLRFLLHDRFEYAVAQRRWQDAGSTIMRWRQLEPERKDLRMLSIAIFQIIGESTKAEKDSKMNFTLATATVKKLIDQITDESDLLLVIDVLVRQKNFGLLLQLVLLKDSVLHDRIRGSYAATVRVMESLRDQKELSTFTALLASGALLAESIETEATFKDKEHQARAKGDWKFYDAFSSSWAKTFADFDTLTAAHKQLMRNSRLGALTYMRLTTRFGERNQLFDTMIAFFRKHACKLYCFPELREFALALREEEKVEFRRQTQDFVRAGFLKETPHEYTPHYFEVAETTALSLDYLLTIGSTPKPSIDSIYTFVSNAVRLRRVSSAGRNFELVLAITCALWKAYELDRDQKHIILALFLLNIMTSKKHHNAAVLRILIYKELGLYFGALHEYNGLGIKEIQLETASHIGLSRISISYPFGTQHQDGSKSVITQSFLNKMLDMYDATSQRIGDGQVSLINASRPDLLLELEDMRRVLHHSLSRRVMILELRRTARLTQKPVPESLRLHPATLQMWTKDLEDRRDFNVCENYEALDDARRSERRMQGGKSIPGRTWISYHLWIDEICSITLGDSLLQEPFFGPAPSIPAGTLEPMEAALAPHWQALGYASLIILKEEGDLARYNIPPQTPEEALDVLLNLMLNLPGGPQSAAGNMSKPCPGADLIHSIWLLIDLFQSVARFALAAQDINKNKRKGRKTPWDKVDELTKATWQAFDVFAVVTNKMRHACKTEEIKSLLDTAISKIGGEAAIASDGVQQHASAYAESAQMTWENLMSAKLAS